MSPTGCPRLINNKIDDRSYLCIMIEMNLKSTNQPINKKKKHLRTQFWHWVFKNRRVLTIVPIKGRDHIFASTDSVLMSAEWGFTWLMIKWLTLKSSFYKKILDNSSMSSNTHCNLITVSWASHYLLSHLNTSLYLDYCLLWSESMLPLHGTDHLAL